MATVLIHAGAMTGAMGGLLHNRTPVSAVVADYETTLAVAAESIADEVVAKAGAVALADADSAYMEGIVANITYAVVANRNYTSITDADYAVLAAAICAAAKALANQAP